MERHSLQELHGNESISNDAFQLERDADGLIKVPFIGSGILNIYNLKAESVRDTYQPLIDAIIRDDLPKLFASFNRSWKNLTHLKCEYRIYAKEGQVKWLLGEASPQLLKNGNVVWNGTLSDISKQKHKEQWLRFAEGDFKLDDLELQAIPSVQSNEIPDLEIDFDKKCLRVGGKEVFLPPADLAFYLWLLHRSMTKQEPVACPPDGAPFMDYAFDFLNHYRIIIGELGDDERVTAALKNGMDKGYFLSRKSRVNKAIHAVLDIRLAIAYEIKCFGKRPRSVYAIDIDPAKIII